MWNIANSPSYNPEHRNSIDHDYWSFNHRTKKINIHLSPSDWGTKHAVTVWDTTFITTKDERKYLAGICNIVIDEKVKNIKDERAKAIAEREQRHKEYSDKQEQYLKSIKSINDFENRNGI